MAENKISGLVETALCWLLGALFIYAGALKAWNPAEFAIDIANYQLVPWPVAVGAAFYLPWLEIFCGLALALGPFRAGALRLLIFLMLIFLQALFVAAVRGLDIHCGCFGRAMATSSYPLLFSRDLLILAALGWLLYREWQRRAAAELLLEQENARA